MSFVFAVGRVLHGSGRRLVRSWRNIGETYIGFFGDMFLEKPSLETFGGESGGGTGEIWDCLRGCLGGCLRGCFGAIWGMICVDDLGGSAFGRPP